MYAMLGCSFQSFVVQLETDASDLEEYLLQLLRRLALAWNQVLLADLLNLKYSLDFVDSFDDAARVSMACKVRHESQDKVRHLAVVHSSFLAAA